MTQDVPKLFATRTLLAFPWFDCFEGLDGGGGYKCQLSVKILAFCQLSVKFKAICQLSVVSQLVVNN